LVRRCWPRLAPGREAKAGFGCSTGSDLGGLTLDRALLLPRIYSGIAAGVGDRAGFTIFFNTIDHNGNGVVCVKTEPASSNANVQPHWLYANHFVADNSSVSNG
jgi:hypothetical protein